MPLESITIIPLMECYAMHLGVLRAIQICSKLLLPHPLPPLFFCWNLLCYPTWLQPVCLAHLPARGEAEGLQLG